MRLLVVDAEDCDVFSRLLHFLPLQPGVLLLSRRPQVQRVQLEVNVVISIVAMMETLQLTFRSREKLWRSEYATAGGPSCPRCGVFVSGCFMLILAAVVKQS